MIYICFGPGPVSPQISSCLFVCLFFQKAKSKGNYPNRRCFLCVSCLLA